MPVIEDPMLRFTVEALDDIERVRIAMSNRLSVLTRTEPDEDGEVRGFGLPEDDPRVQQYAVVVAELLKLETAAVKTVQKTIKQGPLATYVKQATGVGEKQAARLLACVGDPYWHMVEDRPRLVSELWAYCGYHVSTQGTAPRRSKGQKMNWNNEARKRAWLIATSCVKTKGHYRDVYDEARAKYAEATHKGECKQCHAQPGDPLKDGHKHARALRLVAKEVLKDMWLASKANHEAAAAQN